MINFDALKTALNGLRSWANDRLKEKADRTEIPHAVSAFENDAGYLSAPGATEPNMQLVTNGDGVTKWEERSFYKVETAKVYEQGKVALNPDKPTSLPVPFEIVAGKDYTVTFNGTEYAVTAVDYADYGMIIAGNATSLGCETPTTEPFGIFAFPGSESEPMIVASVKGTYTVTVTVTAVSIKPMPVEYMPDTVRDAAKSNPIIITDYDSVNVPFDSVKSALEAGAAVVLNEYSQTFFTAIRSALVRDTTKSMTAWEFCFPVAREGVFQPMFVLYYTDGSVAVSQESLV